VCSGLLSCSGASAICDFAFHPPRSRYELGPASDRALVAPTVDSADGHSLQAPRSNEQWDAYHAIRRVVRFERRGLIGVYDPAHPDETRPGHHALLLWYEREPIGTIRIDIAGDEAVFRRVAIREDLQRRGHGRRLLALAEGFSRTHGASRVRSHVDPGAIAFYERCGFRRVGDPGADEALVMVKTL
jgi:GNAT superfamily N-acetyltransferase